MLEKIYRIRYCYNVTAITSTIRVLKSWRNFKKYWQTGIYMNDYF